MTVPLERQRQIRDLILRFIYEQGAGKPGFGIPEASLGDLQLSREEVQAGLMALHNQNLMGGPWAIIGHVSLNEAGQREAERLVSIPLRDPPERPLHIDANYSIVQVAGAGSHLSASLIQSQNDLGRLLDAIARELPRLALPDPSRKEAEDCISALRLDTLGAGAKRALAATLNAILTGAGSQIGSQLGGLLGFSPDP